MPTPEPPDKAETTDVPGPERADGGLRDSDPWEQMPEGALNVPSLPEGLEDPEKDGDPPESGGSEGTGDTGDARETGPVVGTASGEAPAGTGTGRDDSSGADADSAPQTETGSWVDFLPSPVFVLLLGLAGFAGWLSWTAVELDWAAEEIGVTPLIPPLLILVGWIFSLAVHEFGHALAAFLFGNRSLRGTGYLRLNPFAFREAFAGLVLPVLYLGFAGFGMTGPATYVDWERIPGRGRRAVVALAGPLASLLVAAGFAVAVVVLVPAGNDTTNWAIASLAFLCLANLSAALINLLPLPGLDAFELLPSDRPRSWIRTIRANAVFGSVAVFAVLWFPTVNSLFEDALFVLTELVTPNPAFPGIAFLGQLLLQFWA